MHPNPPHSARRRATPVTLLIGIKCKDAVVLASDSQITYGTSKRNDGAKMEIIGFGLHPVIVAQSGDVIMSNRFVDILRSMVIKYGNEPKDAAFVAEKASLAMRELRREQREVHFNCSSEELTEIFRKSGADCAILLGFFINKTPHLVSVNLGMATAQIVRYDYEAEGCGAALGLYLLEEIFSRNISQRAAALLAVYIVEMVKRHDAMCGGQTKVLILKDEEKPKQKDDPWPVTSELPSEYINKCAALLMQADEQMKPARIKKFEEQISAEGFKTIESLYIPF